MRQRLGLVLADDRSLYWRLTGRQNLEFFAVMQGKRWSEARRPAAQLLERVGLAHRDKLVFGYSSGMRARLSIARALLADAANPRQTFCLNRSKVACLSPNTPPI